MVWCGRSVQAVVRVAAGVGLDADVGWRSGRYKPAYIYFLSVTAPRWQSNPLPAASIMQSNLVWGHLLLLYCKYTRKNAPYRALYHANVYQML
jgi:hypothetical protein